MRIKEGERKRWDEHLEIITPVPVHHCLSLLKDPHARHTHPLSLPISTTFIFSCPQYDDLNLKVYSYGLNDGLFLANWAPVSSD
jgi:hypothetical protein